MDNLVSWADWQYQPVSGGRNDFKPKKAPFYSLSELHMIPPMDDQLYQLFAPALTVTTTPGINVNTMKEATLKALVPQITKEESEEFFKHRDAEDEDNFFKGADDFFKYLQDKISYFRGDQNMISQYKKELEGRNIRIVTDETIFKITVQSQVNSATKLLEAWVTLGPLKPNQPNSPKGQTPPKPPGAPPPLSGPGLVPGQGDQAPRPDPGLKVTFMRIL
jgi:hypothetical protein